MATLTRTLAATLFGLLILLTTAHQSQAEPNKPVRVFILAGQSNMEGKGAIKHLDQLITDPGTAPQFKHLKAGDNWTERDDVWINFTMRALNRKGSAWAISPDKWKVNKRGPLTVGGYGVPGDRIGPELGFGHTVGDAIDEQVLIIKWAWGGNALALGFRPPSSFPVSDEADPKPNTYPQPAKYYKELGGAEGKVGINYLNMVQEIHDVLANLGEYFPEYQDQGYELSGFVWFQGFNDRTGYRLAEYETNLTHFIKDLRQDLGVPDLPFVIGELGMDGPTDELKGGRLDFYNAQQDAIKDAGNATWVKTRDYVVPKDVSSDSFDGGFHYRGRADTFYNIGTAFGEAALKLMNDKPKNQQQAVETARETVRKKYGS